MQPGGETYLRKCRGDKLTLPLPFLALRGYKIWAKCKEDFVWPHWLREARPCSDDFLHVWNGMCTERL